MLNLSELNFQVNTAKLKEAHDLIQGLVPAMQGVANASGKMAKDTTQAAKATEEVGKAAERADKKLAGVERTLQRQALKNSILRGEIVQLKDAQVSLDKVFTSGQAGMLASLQMAGATAEEYKKLASSFKDFNQITGANKFDDSVNGLTKLRKEVQELTLVQKLQADGYQLSAKEIRDLTRDEEVLKQSKEKGQLTEGQYAAKIAETRQEYIRLSAEKAKFIQQSKLSEEQIKREAQAQARAAAMVGEDAVRLFRENEAAKKAEIKAAREATRAVREAEKEKKAEARAAAQAIAEAEAQKQAAIQRTLDLAKNAGRTLAMIGRSGQMYSPGGGGDGPKPPTEQPMDKAMALFYKEQERNAKAAARANQFLATEMQRVDTILAEMNREHQSGSMLSERHTASIAKFGNQLKMAGVSGTQATAQLESYRQKMQQIEALENRRAQNRLANALAPQISDVAVSLAGGMPLHLVIMQQGLQIRDLIGQSGVAAEHLQKTMRDAMKNMVTSIGGTVAALAQMTGGALMDVGKGMSNFLLQISGVNAGLDFLASKSTTVSGAIGGLRTVIAGVAGALTGGLIVALGVLSYEAVKLIGENNALARSLAMTQGAFGLTFQQSQTYVSGLVAVGASTRESIAILTEMSKTSNLTAKDIGVVGKAAIDMQNYAGIAIEETVKTFDKMRGDPVKALTELAMKTGEVRPEIIALVKELEKQGQVSAAAGIATKTLADVLSVQAERMKKDLHPLTLAWIAFKRAASEGWTEFGRDINSAFGWLSDNEKVMQRIAKTQSEILSTQKNLKMLEAVGIKGDDSRLKSLQDQLKADQQIIATQRRQSENRMLASELNRKTIRETEDAAKIRDQYLTKEEQKERAIAKLKADQKRLTELGRPMSQAAYQENLNKIEDQFKDKDAGKAAAAAARYEKSAIEKLNDAYNKTVSKARELSEIEKAMLDIRDDPDYLKRSAAGRKEIEDYAIQLHKKAEAEAIVKKEQDFTKDSLSKLNEAYSKSIGAVKNLTEVERDWLRVQGESGFVQLSAERKNALEAEANALIARTKAILDSKKAIEHGTEMRSLGIQREDIAFRSSLLGVPEEEARKRQAAYDLQKREEQNLFEYAQELKRIQDSSDAAYSETERQRAREKWLEKNQLAKENYELETQALTDMQKRQQAFDGIVKRGFEQMGDSLIDFAVTGKSSFGDMIQSMLVDLAKLEMRMQMMKWYESMGGGKTGSGSILGGLMSLFTGTTQAKGGAWNNGVQMFAKGGVVNRTTAFGMRGGLGIMGEAGPEAIMPLKRGRDGSLGVASAGGSNVQVVVNNYSGAQVKQQETVDSRGNRKVEVVVGEMASGEVQRSGSAMQRGIGSTFGMRPALIAR